MPSAPFWVNMKNETENTPLSSLTMEMASQTSY